MLLDDHEQRAAFDGVTGFDFDLFDSPADRAATLIFHFHRLDDHQSLPLFDGIADRHQHGNNLSWHRHRHHLAPLELQARLRSADPHAPLIDEVNTVITPVDEHAVFVIRVVDLYFERAVIDDQRKIGSSGFLPVTHKYIPLHLNSANLLTCLT